MGWFDILRARKADPEPETARYATAAIKGLDIDNAIAAHENWSLRLLAYVKGKSNETLDTEHVCSDRNCGLGKWIYSQGVAHFRGNQSFEELVRYHSLFHYHASNVVAYSLLGERERAERELRGRYADLSWRVVNSLRELKQATQRF